MTEFESAKEEKIPGTIDQQAQDHDAEWRQRGAESASKTDLWRLMCRKDIRRGSRILKWGVNFCNNVIFYRAKAWLRCLRSVQRRALKELIKVNYKEIILKKADKGRTTVVMNGENKINDGQKQLDDRNNCQPLDEPMVRDTSQRVKHLINALHQAGCIDEMTVKWFNLTPNPPRSPVFYTLTKIHKPTLVGSQDLSYLGVMAQQNAYHHS